MSFEGTIQWICKAGHYNEDDWLTAQHVPVECYVDGCKEVEAWRNVIDDTNCENDGMIVQKDLNKLLIDPENEIYQIPTVEWTRAHETYNYGHGRRYKATREKAE